VASGGKSVFYARYLADRYHAPLVFCGSPSPYPLGWFDCVLSTETEPTGCRKWIHTDVLLNPITPDIVASSASELDVDCRAEGIADLKIGAVLIGGRSRSQHFSDNDWLVLADQMNILSERKGWRWLVATSRRTGAEAEALLEKALVPGYVLDAVWWAKSPRKVVRAYLGYAQAVFVGRDSMTMISEAVCSGRPVVVFGPEKTAPSALIDGFLQNLENKDLIPNRTCSNLGGINDPGSCLTPLSASPVRFYAQQVLDILADKLSFQLS